MACNTIIKLSSRTKTILNRSSKLLQPITVVPKNVQTKNEDVLSKSQKLLLDLGIIRHSSPGSFHFLPLGVRSFDKLCKIVDREMQNVDAQKVILPTLTNVKLWKKSGRISDAASELFKLTDRHSTEYILSPTHEESAADLMASLAPIPYKEFPVRFYQVTSKYRDEMKPRFGLMRGRQFFMKDLYSFDIDLDSARVSYEAICSAYDVIFDTLGVPYVKVSGTTGTMGGTLSHEYHFLSEIGEDKISSCTQCGYKANVELVGHKKCANCSDNRIQISNGIEVGHTFLLGDKYSKPLKATYTTHDSKKLPLQMGSYGLGLSRIIAAAVEVLSHEHEIRWPNVLAPYSAVIIPPKDGSKEDIANKLAPEEIYHQLESVPHLRNEVLFDDRNHLTIGRRVLDAKRTGYPYIIVLGSKSIENPPLVEVIDVNNVERLYLSCDQLLDFMSRNCNFDI